MRIIRWLPALLLGLVLGQFASAADPSVMLTICNAGKVDLDAYLIRPGSALTTHVASAKCAVLEKVEGPAKPGTIGFGFTDTKGQWGGVRRTEVWPDSINSAFEPTKQTLTVKHGAANASIAGLVSYTSAAPYCAQTQSTTAPRAPATTTAGRIADAVRGAPLNDGPVVCHDQTYSLTVIPYPDSHELAFDSHCYPCESPEERAALENLTAADMFAPIANAPGRGGPIGQGILNLTQSALNQDQAERSRRNEIAKGPYQMNWKDLSSFITSAFGMQRPLLTNRHILLRGTVSRVQLPAPRAEIPSVHVYFKEAAIMDKPIANLAGDYFINKYIGTDQTFSICAADQSIFSDTFGANFVTAMVDKSVEMEGEVNSGACGTATGIRIDLAHQFKLVMPGMAMASGQTWVPVLRSVHPQPSAPPVSASRTPASPAAVNQEEITRIATARAATRGRSAAPTPAPVATAPVTPSRAPATPPPPVPAAAQPTDALVTQVLQLVKSKQPEATIMRVIQGDRRMQRMITAADRATLEDAGASEAVIAAVMSKATPANAQPSDPIVEQVMQLLKAKVPEAQVMTMVGANAKAHTLNPADRTRLEDAGASESLIAAIEKGDGAAKGARAPTVYRPGRIAPTGTADDAKGKACQEEAKLYFPSDAVAQAKAVLTCMGAK